MTRLTLTVAGLWLGLLVAVVLVPPLAGLASGAASLQG